MSENDAVNDTSTGMKLTYDDYLLFPDDGQRHELIDGEHYVTPTPVLRHQRILGNLHFRIRAYLESHQIGEVFVAPLDTILSRFDVVQPDLLYISNARRAELLSGQWVTGAPDLVVEIGSPSTRARDETIKRRLYERAGVSAYWFVDPEVDVVRVYLLVDERFAKPIELSREGGDVLTTSLLPGLEVSLGDIFKD